MSAYPGIELAGFKGDLQDAEEKQTVTVDHIHAQHDQKQAALSEDSTNTSVGFLDGGAHRYTKDLPPGSLIQRVSNQTRREKRLKILCILAVIFMIVIVVPVGVSVSRKKRWGFALFYTGWAANCTYQRLDINPCHIKWCSFGSNTC